MQSGSSQSFLRDSGFFLNGGSLSVCSWDLSSNFKAWGLRRWGSLICILFSDGLLFSRMFAWRSAALVFRTRRIGPKMFGRFRKIAEESGGSASCDTQPNCRASFTEPLHFCRHPASACCSVVPQPFCAQTSTYCRMFKPILTGRIHIREDANSHKVIWCKYLSRSFCTAVDWSLQMDSSLWSSFSSTHLHLFVLAVQRVERFSVSVLHAPNRRGGNCIAHVSNTNLLLSTDSKFLVSFQYHLILCES